MNTLFEKQYTEITIILKHTKNTNVSKFYLVKQVLAKCDCETYHFLEKGDGIKIWVLGLRNKDELEKWFELAEIKYKFGEYERSHITELITAGCKSAIESLGFYTNDTYSLMYYIHTILTSLFMGWEEQEKLYKYLAKNSSMQIKAYKKKKKKDKQAKIKSGEIKCPACGKKAIYEGSLHRDGKGKISDLFSCNHCKGSWQIGIKKEKNHVSM